MTKTIAYNLKNITDLKDYDGNIFKGGINLKMISTINKAYLAGENIFIYTEIRDVDTIKFLKNWGCLYTKVINIGIKD